jgi:glycine/D-amino acid oxidase-like deaminating enzyme
MAPTRSVEAEVCVIGAGIMGLSASWELSKRGIGVLCLDRSRAGGEASGSNAGTLAIQNKHLGAIPLTLESIGMWQCLSEELERDVEYEQRGGFRVAHTSEEVVKLEKAVDAQRALGVRVEMVYPPNLFELAPYLSREAQAAGYCADDGMANPLLAARAHVAACRRRGVAFEFDRGVESIDVRADGTFTVHAAGLDVVCETVIAAAGAWIFDLCHPLGIELPLYTKIQQVMITAPTPPLFPEIVTHISGRLTLKQQSGAGKVLVGGGWLGDDSADGDGSGGLVHHRLLRDSVTGNLALALRTVPALAHTHLLRAWTGAEGRSPDRLPLVGSVGDPAGLHLLGCGAGGFTLAPVCGLLAAQQVVGETSPLFSEEISARRFLGASQNGPSQVKETTQ